MLTTTFQTQQVPMPVCRYEVLSGGPTGAPVLYAKVGDTVSHSLYSDDCNVAVKWMINYIFKIKMMSFHKCKVIFVTEQKWIIYYFESRLETEKLRVWSIKFSGTSVILGINNKIWFTQPISYFFGTEKSRNCIDASFLLEHPLWRINSNVFI